MISRIFNKSRSLNALGSYQKISALGYECQWHSSFASRNQQESITNKAIAGDNKTLSSSHNHEFSLDSFRESRFNSYQNKTRKKHQEKRLSRVSGYQNRLVDMMELREDFLKTQNKAMLLEQNHFDTNQIYLVDEKPDESELGLDLFDKRLAVWCVRDGINDQSNANDQNQTEMIEKRQFMHIYVPKSGKQITLPNESLKQFEIMTKDQTGIKRTTLYDQLLNNTKTNKIINLFIYFNQQAKQLISEPQVQSKIISGNNKMSLYISLLPSIFNRIPFIQRKLLQQENIIHIPMISLTAKLQNSKNNSLKQLREQMLMLNTMMGYCVVMSSRKTDKTDGDNQQEFQVEKIVKINPLQVKN